ncbi:MAG: CAP domain-containing protein [Patescibacteria group bacterium]|nr:CAP domain-containing protein [Patescibacteria group bacterium]
MVENLNGRLVFTYGSLKKEYNKRTKAYWKLSLLGTLMGIFLLPNLAYLSAITPEKLIELTNRIRLNQGMESLTANQLLTQAAIQKGETILDSNIFNHTIDGKRFSSWIRDTGYNYSYVGENLAIDFATSEGVLEAWENSPLHKKNLLSPYYKEIGIATIPGKFQGQDTMVVVQVFGAPAVGSAAPWAVNGEFDSGSVRGEINLFNPQLKDSAQNLLTHSIINQELLPLDSDKLTLPAVSQVNTFVIQPNYRQVANNFPLIFSLLITAYFLIFLYSYYFFKINKLSSV